MKTHTRQRGLAPADRCDVCRGRGLLELRPLPDGRFACPTCRARLEQRAEARGAEAKRAGQS